MARQLTGDDVPISTPSAEGRRQRTRRVNIRHTHPALYREIMILALGSALLALNFWTSNPTFNPFGIHKNIVGCVFFSLGASLFVFLNVARNLRMVRIMQGLSVGVYLLWGLINTQQSFKGNASFQLPIVFVTLSAVQFLLALEPPVNPLTEKKK